MTITAPQLLAVQTALGPALMMPADELVQELERLHWFVAMNANLANSPTRRDAQQALEAQRKAAAAMRTALEMRGAHWLTAGTRDGMHAALQALEADLAQVDAVVGREDFFGQRPAAELATQAVWLMADLYERATGKAPTITTDPVSLERGGVFVGFAEVAMPLIGITASPNTLDHAVRSRPKSAPAAEPKRTSSTPARELPRFADPQKGA